MDDGNGGGGQRAACVQDAAGEAAGLREEMERLRAENGRLLAERAEQPGGPRREFAAAAERAGTGRPDMAPHLETADRAIDNPKTTGYT